MSNLELIYAHPWITGIFILLILGCIGDIVQSFRPKKSKKCCCKNKDSINE